MTLSFINPVSIQPWGKHSKMSSDRNLGLIFVLRFVNIKVARGTKINQNVFFFWLYMSKKKNVGLGRVNDF